MSESRNPATGDVVEHVRVIPLTRGKITIVDAGDYDKLAIYKWHASCQNGVWSARRSICQRGTQRDVYMHRVIMDAPAGVEVDHQDGDGLNNRRSNLRLSTRSQNERNKGPRKDNTSGYKGVFRDQNRWRAALSQDGKTVHLGSFRTPEAAARAYDAGVRMLEGDFAWLNFPEEGRVQNAQR